VIGYAPAAATISMRARSDATSAATFRQAQHRRPEHAGRGSIKAANFLYTIAPKDGTTFGGFARGAVIDPLLGRGEGAQYDVRKFGWLGSISNEVGVCAFRSGVAYQIVCRHAYQAFCHWSNGRRRPTATYSDRPAQDVQAAGETRGRLCERCRGGGRDQAQ